MWRKIATIKKTLFINVYNNQTVNIASMTNGVGWSNSNCVYGTSRVSPKHNIYKSEIFCNKVNDNVYKFNFRNSKYSQVLRRGVINSAYMKNGSNTFYYNFKDLKHIQFLIRFHGNCRATKFEDVSVDFRAYANSEWLGSVGIRVANQFGAKVIVKKEKIIPIQIVADAENYNVHQFERNATFDCYFMVLVANSGKTQLEVDWNNNTNGTADEGSLRLDVIDMEYVDLATTNDTSGKGEVIFYEQN